MDARKDSRRSHQAEKPATGPLRPRAAQEGRPGALRSPTGPPCPAAIAAEVQERVRTIQATLRQLRAEPSVAGKLQAWDRILAQVEVLGQYEAQGLLTTCPPPSVLLQEFQAQREALAQREGA